MIMDILKADKQFNPLPLDPEDEIFRNGIFHFNITKMRSYIRLHPDEFNIENVLIRSLDPGLVRIDESHIHSVRSKEPIILAEISPGRYNVIDGNHRLEKARGSGQQEIKAYKLKARQHLAFLTTRSAYFSYIEYWNKSDD